MLSILILLIFACIILIIVGIFVTFKAYKFVKNIILNNSTNYTDFDNISKEVIEKYKDCKVKTIYVCKGQIRKLYIYIFNLFLKYSKSDQSIKDGKNINLYHSFIILELECGDNYRKFIKIDKSQKITITDKIIISKDANFVSFRVKKQITFKRLLDETEKMYGTVNFYNWDAKNNNCCNIVVEFMKILEIKKRIDFIDELNKINNLIIFGDCQLYIWKCMVFINCLDFMDIHFYKESFQSFFKCLCCCT